MYTGRETKESAIKSKMLDTMLERKIGLAIRVALTMFIWKKKKMDDKNRISMLRFQRKTSNNSSYRTIHAERKS